MCGIFAVVNKSNVTNGLLKGLQALAYRGYDSAGIAVVNGNNLQRRRASGKLQSLSNLLEKQPLDGHIGIGHTRWATHGAPTTINAHPHMTEHVAVAHNGIVENYTELRQELDNLGYQFESDTDSEIIPVMITYFLACGFDNTVALRKTLQKLKGSFALVAIFKNLPNTLYAARRASPLVIGKALDGYCLASDENALRRDTTSVCHLEDDDLACIQRNTVTISDSNSQLVKRTFTPVTDRQSEDVGKNGYAHYMLKEIHEQPKVIEHTLAPYIIRNTNSTNLANVPLLNSATPSITLVACGTSLYAGMIGKHWFESLAGVPTHTDVASEFRYRDAPLDLRSCALFISQSGETADTLAALRHSKAAGQSCLSIINQVNSTMEQECDAVMHTHAGQEIGVASTKAFTSQLCVLLLQAIHLARSNQRINTTEATELLDLLHTLPLQIKNLLSHNGLPELDAAAELLSRQKNALYLGRGVAYPLALEGALKLKEISYIHAEAYPSGELKHGPIALVDEHLPVVMISPPGPMAEKSLSNLREIHSRGAKVILISDRKGVQDAHSYIEHAIVMPEIHSVLQALLYAIPLQLLAYRVAVHLGTDIDQPRNLAKSVTVE